MKHFDINIYLDNDGRYLAEIYAAVRKGDAALTTDTERTLARVDVTGTILPMVNPEGWGEDFEDYWVGTDDGMRMPVGLGPVLAPIIAELRAAE